MQWLYLNFYLISLHLPLHKTFVQITWMLSFLKLAMFFFMHPCICKCCSLCLKNPSQGCLEHSMCGWLSLQLSGQMIDSFLHPSMYYLTHLYISLKIHVKFFHSSEAPTDSHLAFGTFPWCSDSTIYIALFWFLSHWVVIYLICFLCFLRLWDAPE